MTSFRKALDRILRGTSGTEIDFSELCKVLERLEIQERIRGAHPVEVPELPGCAADGQTYQEALAQAEIVIDEWIETAKELGRDIPEPRGRLTFA